MVQLEIETVTHGHYDSCSIAFDFSKVQMASLNTGRQICLHRSTHQHGVAVEPACASFIAVFTFICPAEGAEHAIAMATSVTECQGLQLL